MLSPEEFKKRKAANDKKYRNSEKGRAAHERRKEKKREWERSERGKAVKKAWRMSERGKASIQKRLESDKHKELVKKYVEENKEKIKERMKWWRKTESGIESALKYEEKRKRTEPRNAAIRKQRKFRKDTDINFKLKCNLRTRISSIISGKLKGGSAVNDMDCSIEFLKQYLESKFITGMTWENYGRAKGQWSIDHILPLSSFDLTDREQFLRANHYTNLQPLWHIDNMKKKDKIL